jgi:hypothetical protein
LGIKRFALVQELYAKKSFDDSGLDVNNVQF